MRRTAPVLALLLAACAETGLDPLLPSDAETPPAATETEAGAPQAAAEAPEAEAPAVTVTDSGSPSAVATDAGAEPAADVPHIYMALQSDPAGPTSVVLTIDESRDGTPSDDPAIRITPVNGQCNPQQLRWYEFPAERAQQPAYGPEQAARGITARELPDFMATAVTSEMLAAGVIDDPEQSHPQNVCTRKLLQRMIIDRSAAAG